MRTKYSSGRYEDCCDQCGAHGVAPVYDVFFDKPGTHYGLYDERSNPIFITSPGHKAHVMKEQKVHEGGDRKRGAINFDPVYARIAKRNFEDSLRRH